MTTVEIDIDVSAAISLSSHTSTNGELSSLINDGRNLMKNIPHVWLKHCYREATRCGKAFEKFGSNMEDDFVIFESPPSIIAALLHFDWLDLIQDHNDTT